MPESKNPIERLTHVPNFPVFQNLHSQRLRAAGQSQAQHHVRIVQCSPRFNVESCGWNFAQYPIQSGKRQVDIILTVVCFHYK